MTTFHRRRGDLEDPIVARLNGIATLEGIVAAVTASVRRDNVEVALACTVTNAAEREVTVDLDPWQATAEKGEWQFDISVLFQSGALWTWPREWPPDSIIIT